jgi:hypothetical protein
MSKEIKIVRRSNGAPVEISTVSKTSRILEDALTIISEQISTFKAISGRNNMLDEKQAKLLEGYIKSLVILSKEEREREKSEKDLEAIANMSNEQLIEYLEKAKGGEVEKKD